MYLQRLPRERASCTFSFNHLKALRGALSAALLLCATLSRIASWSSIPAICLCAALKRCSTSSTFSAGMSARIVGIKGSRRRHRLCAVQYDHRSLSLEDVMTAAAQGSRGAKIVTAASWTLTKLFTLSPSARIRSTLSRPSYQEPRFSSRRGLSLSIRTDQAVMRSVYENCMFTAHKRDRSLQVEQTHATL